MNGNRYKFTIVCEWGTKKKWCTEFAVVFGDCDAEAPNGFVIRATKEFTDKGWRTDRNPTLCPVHNTAANRKKLFPKSKVESIIEVLQEGPK